MKQFSIFNSLPALLRKALQAGQFFWRSQILLRKTTLSGFTLIEMLVVMTIVGILGSMLVVIFVNVLRGSSKSNSQIILRQNGNYALSQIASIVRYSKNVISPVCSVSDPVAGNILEVTAVDDRQMTYTCPASSLQTITVNDGVTTSPLFDIATVSISSCSFTCIQQGPVSSPVIGIQFVLARTSGTLPNTSATSPFSTTISLRNFEQ